MTDLGTLGGSSRAEAINSKGQVVGFSFLLDRTEPPFRHAFLWEKGGPMIDLNTLIPTNSSLELVAAQNINDRGEIVGLGVPGHCFVDFCGHVFLLIPCAENNAEDCQPNAEGAIAVTQRNPAPFAYNPTISAQGRRTPSDNVASWRSRWAQRYHIPGLVMRRD
jgi:probable HAF family extracellular repeat protein